MPLLFFICLAQVAPVSCPLESGGAGVLRNAPTPGPESVWR
jgi:hypothetical protein